MPEPVSLTWDQVGAWRMQRHFLERLDDPDAVEIARRLCGIQAQVPSAAALAVAVRQKTPRVSATSAALAQRTLMRTWAMRGTLHLLPPDLGAAVLALMAHARSWHKGSWQKTFVELGQVEAMGDAVFAALADGAPLTRPELMEQVLDHTGDESLAEHLASGWSAVLKPLAWQGLLCQGPSSSGRVTFVRPDLWFSDWPGLPAPDDAAPTVIRAYLGAFGPSSAGAFDQWLIRGATPKAHVRRWFSALEEAGSIVEVDVEGVPLFARPEDVDELATMSPSDAVRLVPAFDQFVLGPGTSDEHILDPAQRAKVSRAAGWITPLVLAGGRIAGTWELVDGVPVPDLFTAGSGTGAVPAGKLATEVKRLTKLLSAVQPQSGDHR